MLPRIVELLESKDFKVITKWNTNEIRCVDFSALLASYPDSQRNKILSKEVFSTISYNKISRTIFFPNLLKYVDENGNTTLGELDFCPDVLYNKSELLER